MYSDKMKFRISETLIIFLNFIYDFPKKNRRSKQILTNIKRNETDLKPVKKLKGAKLV
jgi:hypothetical protein